MNHSAVFFSRLVGLAVLGLVTCASNAEAYRVRLAWRPVAGVSGYKLYARQNGYPTPTIVDLGRPVADAAGIMRYEHAGLLVESTNTFSLASYDAAGVESLPSNELSVGYATAATIVDSDGDGLTDAREDTNLSLTRDSGETDRLRSDSDGDGTNDGAEVAAGTDPLDPNSRPGATRTPTPVRTATPTPTRTATPVRTTTRTATRTSTPQPTRTPARTATPVQTSTATPMRTTTLPPSTSATPRASITPARTATAPPPVPTATPFETGTLAPPVIVSVERVD
jgi:hypothetical protein